MPTLKQALNSNAWNYMFAKNTAERCDVTMSQQRQRRHVALHPGRPLLRELVRGRQGRRARPHEPLRRRAHPVPRHRQRRHGREQDQPGPGRPRLPDRHERRLDDSLHASTRVNADDDPERHARRRGPDRRLRLLVPNAKPGPTQACTTTTGTPPAFEGTPAGGMNNNAGTINLTPSSSYSCKYYDIPPTRPPCSASSPGTTRRRS